MKALVTGASGFIGSTLIGELNRKGWQVKALMRASSSDRMLKGLEFERASGDLGDEGSLVEACKGVEVIFHLAGVVTGANRDYYFEHNVNGTTRLARAAVKSGAPLKAIVFVSSLAAGGPSTAERPREETDLDQPVSFYGQSKLAAEQEILDFRDRLPLRIVRPPLVYGPKDAACFLFFKSVQNGVIPKLPSRSADGRKRLSAVHVEDLCAGLIQAATATVSSGEKFFLSAPDVFTDTEMFETIALALNKKPFRLRVPQFALQAAAWAGEFNSMLSGRTPPLNRDKLKEILVDAWTCSSAKAKRELGFQAKFQMREGFTRTAHWYRENGWLK